MFSKNFCHFFLRQQILCVLTIIFLLSLSPSKPFFVNALSTCGEHSNLSGDVYVTSPSSYCPEMVIRDSNVSSIVLTFSSTTPNIGRLVIKNILCVAPSSVTFSAFCIWIASGPSNVSSIVMENITLAVELPVNTAQLRVVNIAAPLSGNISTPETNELIINGIYFRNNEIRRTSPAAPIDISLIYLYATVSNFNIVNITNVVIENVVASTTTSFVSVLHLQMSMNQGAFEGTGLQDSTLSLSNFITRNVEYHAPTSSLTISCLFADTGTSITNFAHFIADSFIQDGIIGTSSSTMDNYFLYHATTSSTSISSFIGATSSTPDSSFTISNMILRNVSFSNTGYRYNVFIQYFTTPISGFTHLIYNNVIMEPYIPYDSSSYSSTSSTSTTMFYIVSITGTADSTSSFQSTLLFDNIIQQNNDDSSSSVKGTSTGSGIALQTVAGFHSLTIRNTRCLLSRPGDSRTSCIYFENSISDNIRNILIENISLDVLFLKPSSSTSDSDDPWTTTFSGNYKTVNFESPTILGEATTARTNEIVINGIFFTNNNYDFF